MFVLAVLLLFLSILSTVLQISLIIPFCMAASFLFFFLLQYNCGPTAHRQFNFETPASAIHSQQAAHIHFKSTCHGRLDQPVPWSPLWPPVSRVKLAQHCVICILYGWCMFWLQHSTAGLIAKSAIKAKLYSLKASERERERGKCWRVYKFILSPAVLLLCVMVMSVVRMQHRWV